MVDFQQIVFRAALHTSELSSLVLFGVGLLYSLQGYRFSRVLVAITVAASAFLVFDTAGEFLGVRTRELAAIACLACGVAAFARYRVGLNIGSIGLGAVLGHYLAMRFKLPAETVMMAAGAGSMIGIATYVTWFRATPVLLTTIPGAGFLMVGFLGLAASALPSMAHTFVSWTASWPLMAPALLGLLTVMGFSVQANALQGDMEVGGKGLNAELAS